jgi:hypothetical protein
MMEVWVCTYTVDSAAEESTEKLEEVHDILDAEHATAKLFGRLWERVQKKARIHDHATGKYIDV